MAMGKRKRQRATELWVPITDLPVAPSHPFYRRLNDLLRMGDFDRFVERACQPFYAERLGRPSLAPGVYFRLLFVGYFEGIDSERGIAWRAADSLALRDFLGWRWTRRPPITRRSRARGVSSISKLIKRCSCGSWSTSQRRSC